jgi:N-methylhydantoinase B
MKVRDAITTQVLRYAMEQVADEMGYTLVRTARSTIIKEVKDIACAVFDRHGNTVAQAHHAPMLLTGFELGMRALRRHYADDELEDGDVIVFNDPYAGGQHVMDMVTFAPVRWRGKLAGFVGSIAHHSDMGGAAPGGTAGGLTEIYLEGLRLPFIGCTRREDASCSVSWRTSACRTRRWATFARRPRRFVGVQRVKAVYEQYGAAVVQQCLDRLLDGSEARIRAALREIPDGDYTGVDWIDDDGFSEDPIKLQVNIHEQDDSVAWTSTARRRSQRQHQLPAGDCSRRRILRADRGDRPTRRAELGLLSPVYGAGRPGADRQPAHAGGGGRAHEHVAEDHRGDVAGAGAGAARARDGRQPRADHQLRLLATTAHAQALRADRHPGRWRGRAPLDGRDGRTRIWRVSRTRRSRRSARAPGAHRALRVDPDTGGAGRRRGALGLRRDIRILTGDVRRLRRPAEDPAVRVVRRQPGAMGRFVLNPHA